MTPGLSHVLSAQARRHRLTSPAPPAPVERPGPWSRLVLVFTGPRRPINPQTAAFAADLGRPFPPRSTR